MFCPCVSSLCSGCMDTCDVCVTVLIGWLFCGECGVSCKFISTITSHILMLYLVNKHWGICSKGFTLMSALFILLYFISIRDYLQTWKLYISGLLQME